MKRPVVHRPLDAWTRMLGFDIWHIDGGCPPGVLVALMRVLRKMCEARRAA